MNESIISKILLLQFPEVPKVAIILGSGLGNFVNTLSDKVPIPYKDIKGYPQTAVPGHSGKFVFGYKNKIPILCAMGRFHYYEGYSMETVTFPVRLFNNMGCKKIIITNSAGCVRKDWAPGDLMIINGYIDYSFINDNHSTDIIDIPNKLDKEIIDGLPLNNSKIRWGVYTYTLGPSYETTAEIKDIESIGGDAVGMSTIPELKEALYQGCNVIGISCLTNYGAGISNNPLNHKEVLETAEQVKDLFGLLLETIILQFS